MQRSPESGFMDARAACQYDKAAQTDIWGNRERPFESPGFISVCLIYHTYMYRKCVYLIFVRVTAGQEYIFMYVFVGFQRIM